MPLCKNCQNNRSFGCSKVPPAAPTANGPLSGLFADFDAGENLVHVTCMGADKKTIKAAARAPREFYDTCLNCGSPDIEWNNSAGIK